MKAKGMRNVPTLQGLSHRGTPESREQAVTELARLEHEKARLEREIALWDSKKQQREKQCQKIEQRLEALKQSLYGDVAPRTRRKKSQTQTLTKARDDAMELGWKEIPLEY